MTFMPISGGYHKGSGAGWAEINAKLPRHATPSPLIRDGIGAGNCWRYWG